MTAKAVTFAVQIGSRGFDVARAVSQRLNYRYYDWEVTSQAAREAGVSADFVAAAEQGAPLMKRIMERLFAASAFVQDDTTLEGPNTAVMESAIRTLTSDDYRGFIERVVAGLGEEGNVVIVGHASQIVLKDDPAVLKVLICGSSEVRADRLSRDEGLPKDEALAAVQSSDRERINFFRQTYKVDLLNASQFDVTINTDEIDADAAVELVLLAASKLGQRQPDAAASAPDPIPEAGSTP